MLKTVVCDDEEHALQLITAMLTAAGAVDVVAACQSIQAAVEIINAQDVDLVVLDIEMPTMTGVQAYAQLTKTPKPLAIFATAHAEYAVEAFGIDAIDYILKPFDQARVQKAVAKAARLHRLIHQAEQTALEAADGADEGSDLLRVRDAGKYYFIPYKDVIWIEAAGDYSLLHTAGKEAAIRMPIKDLEASLPRPQFARVHRSAIVATAHIREIRMLSKGEASIVLSDEAVVKSSRSYADIVRGLAGRAASA